MYYRTIKEIEEIAVRIRKPIENVHRENKHIVIILSNGIRVRIKDF